MGIEYALTLKPSTAASMRAGCPAVVPTRSPALEVDQREACRRIAAAPEMRRCFDEHDLERGADVSVDQMTTVCRAVAFANHDVRVQLRAVVTDRDVPDQRDDLDLFGNLDAFVVALLQLEVSERDALECADAGKRRGLDGVGAGELQQPLRRLVTGVEDEDEAVRVTGAESFSCSS